MIITIKRIRKKTDSIDGQLYIEGMRICDCAENAKSAIKAGTYPVVITKCKQHARKMPCVIINGSPKCDKCKLLDCVSNNTTMPQVCPQIKAGNGVYHREDGTIIVGEYIAPGCLKHPKEAFSTIYDRLRKSVERQKQREQKETCSNSAESRPGVGDSQRGHEITLVVEEHYPGPHNRELTNYELGTQILNQF